MFCYLIFEDNISVVQGSVHLQNFLATYCKSKLILNNIYIKRLFQRINFLKIPSISLGIYTYCDFKT